MHLKLIRDLKNKLLCQLVCCCFISMPSRCNFSRIFLLFHKTILSNSKKNIIKTFVSLIVFLLRFQSAASGILRAAAREEKCFGILKTNSFYWKEVYEIYIVMKWRREREASCESKQITRLSSLFVIFNVEAWLKRNFWIIFGDLSDR